MIRATKNRFIEKVKRGNFCYICIYEGEFSPADFDAETETARRPYFEQINAGSNAEAVKQVEEFAATWPHVFTVRMRPKVNGHYDTHVVVDFGAVDPVSVPQEPYPGMNGFNVSQIREQVLNEIRAQMDVEKKAAEVEALKVELNSLKTAGGKFAFAMEQLLVRAFPKIMPGAAAVAGTQMQGTEGVELTQGEVEEACADLVEALGADVIVKLARKLKDPVNAGMVGMVQNWANQ